MEKPNIENDVKELRFCAASWVPDAKLLGNAKASAIIAICDAYLALMEEVVLVTAKNDALYEAINNLITQRDLYKAENEGLKAEVESKDAKIWRLENLLHSTLKQVAQRESEHQALREEADQLNADLRYYKAIAENQSGLKLKLEAETRALKATMDNIYDNIKSLPAGHERFALDCIRKLLKPEESIYDNPTDHELNAVLARVAGVEVHYEHPGSPTWFIYEDGTDEDNNDEPYIIRTIWNPLRDANQMEMVEEGLRLHGYDFTIEWRNREQLHYVHIKEQEILRNVTTAPGKKRAVALAVYAMEHGKGAL